MVLMWLVYILYPDLGTEAHLTPSLEEAREIYENAKLKNLAVTLAEVVESHQGWQAD
ncbi:MAG: hypothetical protein ACPLQO_00135 [Desulfotomaculales bacterium]